LSHCDDETVYQNAIPRLMDIAPSMAKQVAVNVAGGTFTSNKELERLEGQVQHLNHGKTAKGLSQMDFIPSVPSIKSRRIAILIADGFDLPVVQAMKAFILAGSATPFIIGPRRNVIHSSGGGEGVKADHHYEGQRSTLFDAILVPSGAEHASALSKNGRAVHWVREAFGHLKVIGAVGEGVVFVRDALQVPNITFAASSGTGKEVVSDYGVVSVGKLDGSSFSEGLNIVKGAKGFAENFAYEVSLHKCWEREQAGLAAMVAF